MELQLWGLTRKITAPNPQAGMNTLHFSGGEPHFPKFYVEPFYAQRKQIQSQKQKSINHSRTKVGMNSLSIYGAKLRNQLPDNFENCELQDFKDKLASWYPPKCYCSACRSWILLEFKLTHFIFLFDSISVNSISNSKQVRTINDSCINFIHVCFVLYVFILHFCAILSLLLIYLSFYSKSVILANPDCC